MESDCSCLKLQSRRYHKTDHPSYILLRILSIYLQIVGMFPLQKWINHIMGQINVL